MYKNLGYVKYHAFVYHAFVPRDPGQECLAVFVRMHMLGRGGTDPDLVYFSECDFKNQRKAEACESVLTYPILSIEALAVV